MHDHRPVTVDGRATGEPAERYELPVITLPGTLEELTRGPVNIGGDVKGMVISF